MKLKFGIFLLLCCVTLAYAAKSTLKYVQILFRHGDRTPWRSYPTDPHQADTWPEGWEQLTPLGMNQLFKLGRYIRKRYVDTGFLKPNYTKGDVYVQSTFHDRTIMSAACMLAGLYPPAGHQLWNPSLPWQPVPVHPIPQKGDYLLRMSCKTYDYLKHELYKSKYIQNLTEQYQDLIQIVGKHSGWDPSFNSLMDMIEPVFIENLHNLSLPKWLRDNDTYLKIIDLKDLRAQLKFYTKKMAMIKGGPLLGRMIQNMEDAMKSNNIKTKINFFSGHKTNINALLSTMGMYDGIHIPVNSAVFVELHHYPQEGWIVEFHYLTDMTKDPKLLKVPDCAPECPFSELKKLTRNEIPDDPVATCDGPKPTTSPDPCPSHAPRTGISSLIVIVLMCLASF